MREMNECKLMVIMVMNDGINVAQLDGRNKALENNLIGCSCGCCCQFNTVIRAIVEVQRRQEKRKEEKCKENIQP